MSTSTADNPAPAAPVRITSDDLVSLPRLKPSSYPHIFRLSEHTILKAGHGADRLAEAVTMRYIKAHTTIPIPDVLDAYLDPRDATQGFLVLSFIEGDVLHDVWSQLSPSQKEAVVDQLRGYVAQLREITSTRIGSVDGSACTDQLFERGGGPYGPYEDEAALNEGVVAALRAYEQNSFVEMVADMVRATKGHRTVLTHGDLAPRNIILQGSKVVGILDWEFAGFWPEYWEYVKALYMPNWEDPWIKERVTDRIMEAYHVEHAVMRQVRDVFW